MSRRRIVQAWFPGGHAITIEQGRYPNEEEATVFLSRVGKNAPLGKFVLPAALVGAFGRAVAEATAEWATRSPRPGDERSRAHTATPGGHP